MTVTGFLRVCSSGMLLLLLATMTTLVIRAGAQTSDTAITQTSAPTAACTAEYATCIADDTCNDCVTAPFSSGDFNDCSETGFFNSDEDCDSNMGTACCLDSVSDFDCMGNDAYTGYVKCYLDSIGCSTEFTCDGALVDSGAPASFCHASTGIAFVCAFMVVLHLMRV